MGRVPACIDAKRAKDMTSEPAYGQDRAPRDGGVGRRIWWLENVSEHGGQPQFVLQMRWPGSFQFYLMLGTFLERCIGVDSMWSG